MRMAFDSQALYEPLRNLLPKPSLRLGLGLFIWVSSPCFRQAGQVEVAAALSLAPPDLLKTPEKPHKIAVFAD